jgi:hypothetical protein
MKILLTFSYSLSVSSISILSEEGREGKMKISKQWSRQRVPNENFIIHFIGHHIGRANGINVFSSCDTSLNVQLNLNYVNCSKAPAFADKAYIFIINLEEREIERKLFIYFAPTLHAFEED